MGQSSVKAEEFYVELKKVWIKYEVYLSERSVSDTDKKFDVGEEIWNKVTRDLEGIIKDIEKEFRMLLGVQVNKQMQGSAPTS